MGVGGCIWGGSFSAPCPKLHVGISGFDSQILPQDLKKKTIHI